MKIKPEANLQSQKKSRRNVFAIASLSNGIGAFIISLTPFLGLDLFFSGCAIAFGIVGLKKYYADPTIRGEYIAFAGIAVGGAYVVFVISAVAFGFYSYLAR